MTDDALFNALAGAASIVEVALGTVSADEAAPDLETNLRTAAGRMGVAERATVAALAEHLGAVAATLKPPAGSLDDAGVRSDGLNPVGAGYDVLTVAHTVVSEAAGLNLGALCDDVSRLFRRRAREGGIEATLLEPEAWLNAATAQFDAEDVHWLTATAGRLVTACQLLSPSLRPATHTTTGGTR